MREDRPLRIGMIQASSQKDKNRILENLWDSAGAGRPGSIWSTR